MLNKIIDYIKKIYNNETLRKKILFTLAIFLVYRFLANVPVPAVDVIKLQQIFQTSQFLNLLNVFSGGTLVKFSVMSVGINPYITASIIIQLATMVSPTLKELQKEGESGRAKLNQYQRLISIPLGIVQSVSVIALMRNGNLLVTQDIFALITIVITLVAGSMILMWLGELITEYGIGNGISMVLFAGIASQLPTAFAQISQTGINNQYMTIVTAATVFLAVIALVVFMNEAVRKIPIQYAKRIRGSRSYGGQKSHLPVKINVAGVMPIIFSVSLMMAPSLVSRVLIGSGKPQLEQIGQMLTFFSDQTSPLYMLIYFLLVFAFSFFTAIIFFNAEDLAEELKKSGAFIPGIRPGNATKDFLEYVVIRVTAAGALFLGFIAILPSLAQLFTGMGSLAIGGTSVLIVVSIVLEVSKQVESMLVGQNYDKYA